MSRELEFTAGVGYTVGADSKITMKWDNGKAYSAIRGATVSYIPKHYHAHFKRKEGGEPGDYSPGADYVSLTVGGVNKNLAFAIVTIRAAGFSLPDIVFNAAEIVLDDAAVLDIATDAELANHILAHQAALNNLIQQSLSIMALNGVSMVTSGHHYTAEAEVWNRFISATAFDTSVSQLRLAAYEGPIFHDTFHMVDIEWLAGMVCADSSALTGHINGVAAKRIPAQPAGTTIIAVLEAMLDDLKIVNAKLYAVFEPITVTIRQIQAKIRANPLDWCSQFNRKGTAKNMAEVEQFTGVAAMVYSYLNTVLTKKPTSLRSKALKSAVNRMTQQALIGQQLAEKFPVAEINVEEFTRTIEVVLKSIVIS